MTAHLTSLAVVTLFGVMLVGIRGVNGLIVNRKPACGPVRVKVALYERGLAIIKTQLPTNNEEENVHKFLMHRAKWSPFSENN